MKLQPQNAQIRSFSVDSQVRSTKKSKHSKNVVSEVMPRKAQLKIIKLDQQIVSGPGRSNLLNIQFAEQPGVPLFKRSIRKPSRRFHNDDKKSHNETKDGIKVRYHELFKQSIDSFSKNSVLIGPWAKSIKGETQVADLYAKRKLINIEKISCPVKKISNTRKKYQTLVNKTTRVCTKSDQDDFQKRNSLLVQETSQRSFRKEFSTQPIGEGTIQSAKQLRKQYKKQIATLIPIRKPTNKKDYFVFGLAQKSTTCQNKIQLYRDLLWKVNYSNALYVVTPEQMTAPYKFFVGEGNNSNLIRGIMRRRFWWTQASHKNQQGVHFLWTQLKVNSFFQQQKSAPLPQYYIVQRNSTEIFKKKNDPNRKIFGRIDFKIWQKHCQANEKTEKKISGGTYQRRVKMYEKKMIKKIEDSKPLRVHNHLQCNYYIGNKKALFYNMKRYIQLKGEDPFSMLPLTFHITKGVEDPQYIRFLKVFQRFQQQKNQNKAFRNIWIVKPGQNTNRGNGISVCYGIDDIKHRLRGRERNGDGKIRTFILQKYIEDPLLYNKRKFDIRHFILITCINGSFKGYWFDQGYVRTSSTEFNLRPGKDNLVHLTNDAIQKNTNEYGKYEKANKLSYAQLQKYLQNSYQGSGINFYHHLIPKMKRFAKEAIKATYFMLDPNKRKFNFQLLGLDFMIDQKFEPWLIEINTNPCLELCCPLLQKIIPSLIENTLKLTIDPLFPPPEAWPNNKKLFFGEDPLSENRFEIIFDEGCDGKDIEKLFNGRERKDTKMGRIQEDQQTFENDGEEEWQAE